MYETNKADRAIVVFSFILFIYFIFQLNKQRNAYKYADITSCLMSH